MTEWLVIVVAEGTFIGTLTALCAFSVLVYVFEFIKRRFS